ncbi:hypothetical protein ACFQHO_39650 [Actinomadura yumaensis]|uniref:hypothetical protein n=1 Tax=Actinomadura yumaensis TaxID=111807 RepID=UPI0036222BC7
MLVRGSEMAYASGPFEAVTGLVFNRTPDEVTENVTWTHRVGSTTGFALRAEVSACFYGIVNASVAASLGYCWTTEDTVSKDHSLRVPAEHAGWLERSAAMQTLTGEIWVITTAGVCAFRGEASVTGPATDGRPAGALVARYRPITRSERRR